MLVVVREFDPERDCAGAEAVDRACEVGSNGKMSLFTDLLGDPVCRIRHSPAFLMLVAETVGPGTEIVGVVRGCVKTVATTSVEAVAAYAKVGYILGLRVSPYHRRLGIGMTLVRGMEQWFRENGVEYAYVATEKDNEASVRLFTSRCGYSKFRTPAILVNPVFAHRALAPGGAAVISLSAANAETLYRRRFSGVEFFPRDIDAVLRNPLSLGTFLAIPKSWRYRGIETFLADPPESWAVLSVWNCKDVFRLEIRGAGRFRKGLAWASRAADRALPWLRIPSVPDLFHPFGVFFLYGMGGEGPGAAMMAKALCVRAHNMARVAGGVRVVATEVASCDPLLGGIPHWRRLSMAEDLWCVRRLEGDDGGDWDWTKSPPRTAIFVDPREI
ncbi:putative transcription regulator GNAT family [Dioscorea sansibarensis]